MVYYGAKERRGQLILKSGQKFDFKSNFIDIDQTLPILVDPPPLPWTPCPSPPKVRTSPEKNSYGPKKIVGNLQKISGRYGQR